MPPCDTTLDCFLPCYVLMLGIYGLFFNLFNSWEDCREILPEEYLQRGGLETWKPAGFYFSLLGGIIFNQPIFYTPFLLLNIIVSCLMLKAVFTKTTVEGLRIPSKLIAIVLLFNWYSVAWTFARTIYCGNWYFIKW